MTRILGFVVLMGLASPAWAQPYSGLPQNAPWFPDPVLIVSDSDVLQQASVEVQLGLGQHNPRWTLSHTHLQMLPAKLEDAMEKAASGGGDPLMTTVKNPEPTYRGLKLHIQRKDGTDFAPMLLAMGKVSVDGQPLMADPGRQLEYWLAGTARIRRDLLLGSQILPVLTFEQCRVLGNPIVDTQPRQCLLPDQNILLETTEPLTRASLKVKDFDSCLTNGEALIYTFPRRCRAAGGRVFTEPPKVYEDAPIVVGEDPKFMLSTAPAVPVDPSATVVEGGVHQASPTAVMAPEEPMD